MKAAFSMWKNTRMIILTAVCAAIYGAALIAFKTAVPLIPGITEVRVGNILPVPFGLLFGPAGAWGAGGERPGRLVPGAAGSRSCRIGSRRGEEAARSPPEGVGVRRKRGPGPPTGSQARDGLVRC